MVTNSARGVQYLEHTLLSIHFDLFAVTVFDGRVVLLDENAYKHIIVLISHSYGGQLAPMYTYPERTEPSVCHPNKYTNN